LINIDEATGRGTVTFEINETGKVKIEDVEFIGNDSFKDRKLRKVLKTRRHWWLSWITGSGVLKEDEFEDDKDRLVEFYQNNGHIDFEIKDIKFEYPKENRVVIQFDISEGRLYKVGDIAFQGNTLFTTNDIYEGIYSEGKPRKMQMLVGETFTPVGLNKDVEAIKDFYGSKGYIDTRVNAVKRPNTTTGTMDLLYEIQENDKSFIEKIEIKGNTKTKDKVIRRELAVAPGEVYDMVRVKLSKQRLEGLNYFEKVDTQPEDTDVPNRKNLVIGVEEKNTGNITMGAGLSSVDSVVGFVEVSQGNFDLFKPPTFTGAGQKFRARVALGTRRKDYQITFIEPWFLGRKLALGVDLYHRELSFLSRLYDEERTGASVSLTRALWSDFLIGKVGYTIENVGLDFDETQNLAPDLLAESGTRLVSKMTASLAYDTRDHALMPTRGQRSEILSELAGGPFGADTDFYKVELKTTWYFPGFAEGHVFEIGGRSGVVERYGESDRVPLFDRWFLGGAYSLRGYRFRQVGPRDSYGQEPIGGRTYWYGSAEYSIPIIERLRFAMFYDIGNVYRDAYQWDFADYADNWGVGLRINLPIGPLVLDYGVPISAPDYIQGGSGRFNFRVGYSKDF
jgi:outer membrane protein insertion porin family